MIDMHVHTYLYWYCFGHIYTCLNTDFYMFIHVYTVKTCHFSPNFPSIFTPQIPNGPHLSTPPFRRNRRCRSLRRDGVFRSRKLLRYLGEVGSDSLGPLRPVGLVAHTPWKIHMEPTNHPFWEENDLPNPMIMFHDNLQGCTVDGSEIRRSPVEVGRFYPVFLQGFIHGRSWCRISSINRSIHGTMMVDLPTWSSP